VKSLSDVLNYENNEVVLRFARERNVSVEDASDVFLETKRWLWLCASSPGMPVNMVGDAFVIDEMWHTFLLFTRDYAEFCQTYLSEFVHHVPKRSDEDSSLETEEAKTLLRQDYAFIYDRLGPDTLLKWCRTFPAKFAHLR
jgi:hypothetical protein